MLQSIYNRARREAADTQQTWTKRRWEVADGHPESSSSSMAASRAESASPASFDGQQLQDPQPSLSDGETSPKFGQRRSPSPNPAGTTTPGSAVQQQQGRSRSRPPNRPPAMLSFYGFTHASDMKGAGLIPVGQEQQLPPWMRGGMMTERNKVLGKFGVEDILAAVTGNSETSMLETIKKVINGRKQGSVMPLPPKGAFLHSLYTGMKLQVCMGQVL